MYLDLLIVFYIQSTYIQMGRIQHAKWEIVTHGIQFVSLGGKGTRRSWWLESCGSLAAHLQLLHQTLLSRVVWKSVPTWYNMKSDRSRDYFLFKLKLDTSLVVMGPDAGSPV